MTAVEYRPTRRDRASGLHRGFAAIGIERAKNATNVGGLWRSAVCLDAAYIFTVGGRYRREASDTVAAARRIPHFDFPDIDAFLAARPHDVPLVGVELVAGAVPLETFVHPRRAVYLLGPEDGSLSRRAQDACQHIVAFDAAHCLNVATAGSIVLYDRRAKAARVRSLP